MARTEIAAEASLDTTKFQRGLAKADKGVKKFAKSSIASVGRIASAFAGVTLVKSIIGLGTAAAETASKFNAVFGPAAAKMNEELEELKKTIPATTMEMQNALATFGQMARSFGLNEEAANMFSVEMVKMAGDLASFHNMRPEDVFLKLRAAISGEFEPLKQLGIVINETTLKQEALNKGIWDGTGAMSAAQKALTTQSLLVKQMGTAQGDAAATADSAANKIKFLQSELKDMGAEIGQTVLPAVVQMVEWLSKAADMAKSASEAVGTFVGEAVYGKAGDMAPDDEKIFRDIAVRRLTTSGELKGLRRGAREQKINQYVKSMRERAEAQEKEKETLEDVKKIEEELTEVVVDDARVKAQDEYNESLKETIEAAGELKSIEKQTAKQREESAKKATTTEPAATFQGQTLNQAMADARKQGIRFQRMRGPQGREYFQRFENGRKAGRMTKEQLEKAAARRPQQKDPSQLMEQGNKYLESIDREIRRNP